jgi:hypothetical protein
VSPLRLKCINASGFNVSIANIGFNNRRVTLLADFPANFTLVRTTSRDFRRLQL